MITNDLQVIDVVYLDFVDNLAEIVADNAADNYYYYYYCIDLQVYNIAVQAK